MKRKEKNVIPAQLLQFSCLPTSLCLVLLSVTTAYRQISKCLTWPPIEQGTAQQMRRGGHSGTLQAFICLTERTLGAKGNKITTDEKCLKEHMQQT